MTYQYAVKFLQNQERNIKAADGFRFTYNGYEFRVTYRGGFAAYFAIDYRQIGKRNFKYFSGIPGYQYYTANQVLTAVKEVVVEKVG